jgi:uncharacterized protein
MLYQTIVTDMKEAMKSQDKESLGTIRMLKSAIDLERINSKLDSITDDLVITVVSRQTKTLNESIVDFKKGNRQDLVDNALREINLLKKYLPAQLSEEELIKIIDETIKSTESSSIKDMGKLMKELTPKIKGKADMGKASSIIKSKLN